MKYRYILCLAAALTFLLTTACAAQAEPALATLPSQPVPETDETLPETTTQPLPETTAETLPPDPIRQLLDHMTLEERVGQLFLARCPETDALEDLSRYHLGGYILFGRDFEGRSPEEVESLLASWQEAAAIPLLIAVDEEGGTVTRVSREPAFRESRFFSPREYFRQGGLEKVLEAEEEKAALLSGLGINVNMAPVADIAVTPGAFMYQRSLGQDAETTAAFVRETVRIMARYDVGSVLKHFPGYGTNTDTHNGSALDPRPLEQLEQEDLVPFRAGIEAGCSAVLVSHNIVTAFDPSLPASLSPEAHRYLRQELGFEGVAITDDLVMGAIMERFDPDEAAVQAVLAGNDLLCCTDYPSQYEAVLAAVLDGRIPIDRLNEAVTRVLRWKQALGLLRFSEG